MTQHDRRSWTFLLVYIDHSTMVYLSLPEYTSWSDSTITEFIECLWETVFGIKFRCPFCSAFWGMKVCNTKWNTHSCSPLLLCILWEISLVYTQELFSPHNNFLKYGICNTFRRACTWRPAASRAVPSVTPALRTISQDAQKLFDEIKVDGLPFSLVKLQLWPSGGLSNCLLSLIVIN